MIPRSVTKKEVEQTPYVIWNAFVDLIALEPYEDLSSEQRPAKLVFEYESQVQNGGHFQYFENRGAKYLEETITALNILGAICQQKILREASAQWLSRSRKKIETAQEFCDTALEGEFTSFDSRFHACSPSLQQCLETYLDRNQAHFVAVT